jgi:hypothetical protein
MDKRKNLAHIRTLARAAQDSDDAVLLRKHMEMVLTIVDKGSTERARNPLRSVLRSVVLSDQVTRETESATSATSKENSAGEGLILPGLIVFAASDHSINAISDSENG